MSEQVRGQRVVHWRRMMTYNTYYKRECSENSKSMVFRCSGNVSYIEHWTLYTYWQVLDRFGSHDSLACLPTVSCSHGPLVEPCFSTNIVCGENRVLMQHKGTPRHLIASHLSFDWVHICQCCWVKLTHFLQRELLGVQCRWLSPDLVEAKVWKPESSDPQKKLWHWKGLCRCAALVLCGCSRKTDWLRWIKPVSDLDWNMLSEGWCGRKRLFCQFMILSSWILHSWSSEDWTGQMFSLGDTSKWCNVAGNTEA